MGNRYYLVLWLQDINKDDTFGITICMTCSVCKLWKRNSNCLFLYIITVTVYMYTVYWSHLIHPTLLFKTILLSYFNLSKFKTWPAEAITISSPRSHQADNPTWTLKQLRQTPTRDNHALIRLKQDLLCYYSFTLFTEQYLDSYCSAALQCSYRNVRLGIARI